MCKEINTYEIISINQKEIKRFYFHYQPNEVETATDDRFIFSVPKITSTFLACVLYRQLNDNQKQILFTKNMCARNILVHVSEQKNRLDS